MILQGVFDDKRNKVVASQEDIQLYQQRYEQGESAGPITKEAGFFEGIGEAWKGLPAGGLKSMSLLEEVAANTGLSHINPDRIEQEGGYVIDDAEKHQEIVRNRLESDAKAHREEANGRFGIEPETVGMAGQVLYGLAETLPKAITASVVAGPAGGAALFGADYGGSQYLELRDKGVDKKTAAAVGAISGFAGAVGVAIPATFGMTRPASATIGALANMGLTGAELGAVGWILDRQNYDALAEQYGFNMTSVITSGIFGGVFGGAMWRPRGRAQAEPIQRFDDVQRKTVNQSIYEQLKAVGGKYGDDVVAHTQADLHANAIENLSRVYDVPFESVESVLPRIVRDDGALNESAFNQIIGERGAYGIVGAEGLRRIQKGEPVPVNNIVDMLSTAKEMHSSGLDARAIRVATGWERGADGYWKYEIPDGKWKIDKLPETGEFKLGDVFDAPELYDAYPELRDIDVSFERDWGAGYDGYFDPSDDKIVINTYDFLANEARDRYLKTVNKLSSAKNGYSETQKRNAELLGVRLESVEELEMVAANLEKVYQEAMAELPEKRLIGVLHEIQHYIQHREGFESGSSPEYFDRLKYQFDYKNSVIAAYQEFKERLDAGENIEKIRGEVDAELKDLGVDSFAANEGYYRALDGEGIEDVIAEVAKFPEAVRNGMDSYVAYRKVGGEVESRNTEIRHKLTEEERRQKLLADTEDVARDQQIFFRTNLFTTSLKTADFVPDADLIARAKENFGVTRDPKEAFYVLPDGSMLDGSGRHWGGSEVDVRGQRQVDHGDVGEVMDSSGAQAMYDFMSQTGAMRFDANAGIASIARTPTPEQLAVLSRASRGKYLALSRNTPEGRIVDDVEFERASASDIRKFFDKAEELYREGVQGALAQRSEGGTLGSYSPATREIKLTPNANLSTFSHEMGHWYLDTMMGLSGRGSALLDSDIATLLREFGVNSIEDWNALGVEGQRKYHEQFASWLEVYLSKGEAPNPSLKDVLARVAQWIVDVYESFGGTQKAVEGRFESEFGTKLPEMSDEVKAVMDRLFSEQKANRKMAAKKPTTEQVAAGRVVLQSSAATARIQKLLKKDRNKLTAKDARDLQDALRASDIAAQQMANGQAVDVADVVGDAEIDESMMKETRGNFAREFLMGGDDSQAVVLQNRDRDTVASVAQMNRIAAKPDYYLASFSRSLQDGAPIVSFGSMPDNAHLGIGDIVVGPDGRRIPVQYAVVEADSVLTSNDYLGNANPDYGNPSMVNAVAGNGRATGIREGYNRGTAEQYKADMIADTRHGVDAEVIKAMKKPLLVRFIGKDEVTSKLIEESNKQSTLARSPVEQAVDDAKLIARNVDKYQFDEDGLPTQETVQQFVADIQDPNALGRLLTPYGTVTPEAVTRVQNAVVQAAYGDMPFTQLFAMETKPGAKRLMNALVAAAPRFVEIRNSLGNSYDFSRQLLEGFKQVRESMLAGQDSVIQSGSIFGDDSASAFIDILDRNRNSMAGVMRELDPIFEAIKASQDSAGSMFGDEILDLPEILSRVRQAENEARLAEGKPLLMDIDAEEMRQGIKAAQEMIEAVEEMQTRALEGEQVQDTQAVDPVERSRQMLTQDADAVRVQELSEEMPEMLFDIEDENGQMVKMSIADITALNEADLAKADTEAASMGEVFACVDLNRGIE